MLASSRFINNEAEKDGGSLYLSCSSANCEFYVSNNTFTINRANNSGGAIKWNDVRPYNLSNNIFVDNSALYGNDIASYPIAL